MDLTLPENKNPQTAREQSEFIEVELVPLEGLRAFLDRKAGEGWTIDARLYTYVPMGCGRGAKCE